MKSKLQSPRQSLRTSSLRQGLVAASVGLFLVVPAWGKTSPPPPTAVVRLDLPFADQAHVVQLPALELAPSRTSKPQVIDPNEVRTLALDSGPTRDVPAVSQTIVGTQLNWRVVGEFRVAQMAIRSPQAASLRVALKLQANQGMSLRFAGSQQPATVYSEASQRYQADTLAWTPTTEGDTQVVEFAAPLTADVGNMVISVASVAHLYGAPGTVSPAAVSNATCDLDTTCQANLVDTFKLRSAMNATAKLTITKPSGTVLCSGTLINSATRTGVLYPYFLTAHHCLADTDGTVNKNTASSIVFNWFFEANECGGSLRSPRSIQTVGAKLLYADAQTDLAFMVLTSPPPAGVSYMNTLGQFLRPREPITAFHHARGDKKRMYLGIANGVSFVAGRNFASINHPDVLASRVISSSLYPIVGGASGGGVYSYSDGGTPLLHGVISAAQRPVACGVTDSRTTFVAPLAPALPALRKYLGEFADPFANNAVQ